MRNNILWYNKPLEIITRKLYIPIVAYAGFYLGQGFTRVNNLNNNKQFK